MPVKVAVDSGASSNYLQPEDSHCATEISVDHFGPTVTLPDASTIQSNKTAQLPLSPQLSSAAQSSHILPGLKSTSLLSVGKMCDDGCDVIFRPKKVHIIKNSGAIDKLLTTNKPILEGKRNYTNGLWDITLNKHNSNAEPHQIVLPKIHGALYPIQSPGTTPKNPPSKKVQHNKTTTSYNHIFANLNDLIDLQECDCIIRQQQKIDRTNNAPSLTPLNHNVNVILRKDEHKKDLANYLHGCCFWPVKSTFLKAIKNNHFSSWPGLDSILITNHLSSSTHTQLKAISNKRSRVSNPRIAKTNCVTLLQT